MNQRISIDGSMGEGGGQIVRTAVTLSALTGRPIDLYNIRARRSRAGLRPQHVACVRAAAEVCQVTIEGDAKGSSSLSFEPGEIQSGTYDWDVGTAGAATLVIQTVLPLLARGGEDSEVRVTGGTHVQSSPTYDYFERVFLPHVKALGIGCSAHLLEYGFYPKGGGRIRFTLRPEESGGPDTVDWSGDTSYPGIRAVSICTRDLKDRRVAERQVDGVVSVFGKEHTQWETHYVDSFSTGTAVLVHADSSPPFPGSIALGEKGKPAEDVGQEAADHLQYCLSGGVPVDRYLPDQLFVVLAMQCDSARIRMAEFSSHLSTQIQLMEKFGLVTNVEKSYLDGSKVVASLELPEL